MRIDGRFPAVTEMPGKSPDDAPWGNWQPTRFPQGREIPGSIPGGAALDTAGVQKACTSVHSDSASVNGSLPEPLPGKSPDLEMWLRWPRAPACHAGDRGFESRHFRSTPHGVPARVRMMRRRVIGNPPVSGTGDSWFESRRRSAGPRFRPARVAQRIERLPPEQEAARSNPVPGT